VTAEAAAAGALARLTDGARGLVAGLGGSGRRTPLVWYGLYTFALFVVCFVATFPHDLLLRRALTGVSAAMPVRIDAGGGSLGWTLAYGIDSLRVGARDGDGEPFLLAETLRFAPSRFGLLRGNPYPLGIDATLYGGSLRGVVDARPAHFAVNATLEGIDLARYTGLRPWVDGSIRGRLEGAVALDGGGRGPAAATGTVRLRIVGLTLEGAKIRGITAPDLHFNEVHLNGTVKNGRLEVDDMSADGQEIALRGEGNVLLREPLASSVLGLDLLVTPAAGASDGLKMMINMLPGTSGEGGGRRVAVSGTLGRPSTR
jgi:type II secretion system protein N